MDIVSVEISRYESLINVLGCACLSRKLDIFNVLLRSRDFILCLIPGK